MSSNLKERGPYYKENPEVIKEDSEIAARKIFRMDVGGLTYGDLEMLNKLRKDLMDPYGDLDKKWEAEFEAGKSIMKNYTNISKSHEEYLVLMRWLKVREAMKKVEDLEPVSAVTSPRSLTMSPISPTIGGSRRRQRKGKAKAKAKAKGTKSKSRKTRRS
jgi:hypothetical protein